VPEDWYELAEKLTGKGKNYRYKVFRTPGLAATKVFFANDRFFK
jgi:hypothetical protein